MAAQAAAGMEEGACCEAAAAAALVAVFTPFVGSNVLGQAL
jgi:hypothetical protein